MLIAIKTKLYQVCSGCYWIFGRQIERCPQCGALPSTNLKYHICAGCGVRYISAWDAQFCKKCWYQNHPAPLLGKLAEEFDDELQELKQILADNPGKTIADLLKKPEN